MARCTTDAFLLPSAASWSMRVFRTETSANSEATKNAFARTRMKMRARSVAVEPVKVDGGCSTIYSLVSKIKFQNAVCCYGDCTANYNHISHQHMPVG